MTELRPGETRLGPIGTRLQARVQQAVREAQAAREVAAGAKAASWPPPDERRLRRARRVREDEHARELVEDVAYEGAAVAVGEIIGEIPGFATDAVQALGELVLDALAD